MAKETGREFWDRMVREGKASYIDGAVSNDVLVRIVYLCSALGILTSIAGIVGCIWSL